MFLPFPDGQYEVPVPALGAVQPVILTAIGHCRCAIMKKAQEGYLNGKDKPQPSITSSTSTSANGSLATTTNGPALSNNAYFRGMTGQLGVGHVAHPVSNTNGVEPPSNGSPLTHLPVIGSVTARNVPKVCKLHS